MRIFRGDLSPGLLIYLLARAGVKRCNQKKCRAIPNTLVILDNGTPVGLCKEHYKWTENPGDRLYTFEFDDFDAFVALEKEAK